MVADKEKYQNYQKRMGEFSKKKRFAIEFILPCFIYVSIGAITWAVRGTSGWGGFDGALVHGMAWGILWYYFSYKRGLDGRGSSFWLGLGVAIGGMWGYGQYHGWIRGRFGVNSSVEPRIIMEISPIYGYIWFWIVGAAWLGIGGIVLGWALENKNKNLNISERMKKWLPRLLIPLGFVGLAYLIRLFAPGLIFPFYSESFYTEIECYDCVNRTISTNTTNFMAIMWWLGACITAAIQKDKKTLLCGTLLGVGFGFLYCLSAASGLGDQINSAYIDWWKIWELNAGLMAGILYAVLQYLIFKMVDKENAEMDQFKNITEKKENSRLIPQNIIEKRANILLTLTVFIFYGIQIYGVGYRLGVLLELFNEDAVNQYAFPPERLMLFLPAAIPLILWTIIRIVKISKASKSSGYVLFKEFKIENIDEKVHTSLLFIVMIGSIVAWPTEIGVIYVFYFVVASLAFWRYLRYIKN